MNKMIAITLTTVLFSLNTFAGGYYSNVSSLRPKSLTCKYVKGSSQFFEDKISILDLPDGRDSNRFMRCVTKKATDLYGQVGEVSFDIKQLDLSEYEVYICVSKQANDSFVISDLKNNVDLSGGSALNYNNSSKSPQTPLETIGVQCVIK